MIIYNVTINIDDSSHDEWLAWMQNIHIPEMLATNKFTEARILKVMVEEEMGGTTYSVQYVTKNEETLKKYYEEDASRLRQEGLKKFADKFVAFRTELKILNEYYHDKNV